MSWSLGAYRLKWLAAVMFVSGLVALACCSWVPELLFAGFVLLWLSLVAGVATVYCMERAKVPPDVEELLRKRDRRARRLGER